ncbi:hypothetical protein EYF80_054343 [Liparis tanakae]|uniref:Uncharacterized protein n=1 Tax=Liparis tanakae TaxID=230148 RepID=A0A4Z2F2X4_9TELE|nr:hypothetical protein EYF80_054343 [Liparis tanakae]
MEQVLVVQLQWGSECTAEGTDTTQDTDHVVACTSFSVREFVCLSRTRMYHIIHISCRSMRQLTKDSRCSSLTEGPWCAMASISAAPISSTLVPYWPLRISAFFLG